MGSLQREVSSNPGTGGSPGLQGVDLSQLEEALAGQGRGGQEPQDEGFPGLYAVRHACYAQPCQCAHPPHGALLRFTVGAKPSACGRGTWNPAGAEAWYGAF